MMLSPYKKYTGYAVLAILLSAIAGFIWFGILPLKQSVYGKMRDIQEFYARQESRGKQVAKLSEFKAQYDTILENEKQLGILISEDAIVDFVKTLEDLANENHIEMSITSKDKGAIIESKKAMPAGSVQVGSGDAGGSSQNIGAKEKPVDILGDLPFDRYAYLNVKARGSYEDIVAFLHKMETLPIGLDVIKVDIKRGEAKETTPALTGSGINPFLSSNSNTSVSLPELQNVNNNIFEAMFDVLVYVDKNN